MQNQHLHGRSATECGVQLSPIEIPFTGVSTPMLATRDDTQPFVQIKLFSDTFINQDKTLMSREQQCRESQTDDSFSAIKNKMKDAVPTALREINFLVRWQS